MIMMMMMTMNISISSGDGGYKRISFFFFWFWFWFWVLGCKSSIKLKLFLQPKKMDLLFNTPVVKERKMNKYCKDRLNNFIFVPNFVLFFCCKFFFLLLLYISGLYRLFVRFQFFINVCVLCNFFFFLSLPSVSILMMMMMMIVYL